MNGLTSQEKSGLLHLLKLCEDSNLIFHLARLITSNSITISNLEDAYNIILLHSSNIHTVLSKKIFTKEILFKYLHKNKCPVRNDFTKASLIAKILEFWENWNEKDFEKIKVTSNNALVPINISQSTNNESDFPINVLARHFSEWFFEKYNQCSITVEDFWLDSELDLKMVSDNCINENQCKSRNSVLETLYSIKMQHKLYFNPSISHDGVQGRLDVHGLALVLICGTLHDEIQCVGVFETVFSLARDPFAENNWKIKRIQLLLRNPSDSGGPPSLTESEAMKTVLSLPMSSNNI